ncbi:MAG: hypothetical protein HQ517_17005, partial [SAR324 cluster bacterium]|nr:hypothetical protein [SAR324 cluster bacterium]
ERNWTKISAKKKARANLVTMEANANSFNFARNIAEVEMKNFPVPYRDSDEDYFRTLLVRSKIIHLGKPTLRYFTTEEAAWYLRIPAQVLRAAVISGALTALKTDMGQYYVFEKEQLLGFAGPSNNPLTMDDSTEKTLAWVAAEFQAEFYGNIPPDAASRDFMPKEDLMLEIKKLKQAFIRLSEVSFAHRAQNLTFFNQLLYPKFKHPKIPKALKNINSFTPNQPMSEGPQ